jgi:sugar transferase EpsL
VAQALKRATDVALAIVGLAVGAPLLLVAASAVWASMGRPVLFRHVRPGLGGKPFTLLKLRTMREEVDARGRPLPDAERLTKTGNLLRRLSVDELPQFWNVLRGEMSLVGPRPLLMQYLALYTPEQARRHEVRPGVTGWAQVNGRNALSWEEKFELDVWYVDHWSLGLDLRIVWLTVVQLLRPRGVSAPGQATMTEFRG